MPDQSVKAGDAAKLGKVEGDLSVGRNATIKAESGSKVTVTGRASFEGPVTIDCDFECQSMRVVGRGFGPGGDLRVNGSLAVEGTADIDASARVSGAILAQDVDVGGHLKSGQITTRRLRVGGHLEAHGRIEADAVDVGGHMTATAEVKIHDLRVGGHARIGGGTITGEIKVRGHFTTTKKLTFGQLQVFGNARLPGGSGGDRLSSVGRVEFEGDASCRELVITGTMRVAGDCTAGDAQVKGALHVSQALRVSRRIEVWGAADVRDAIHCEVMQVGGRVVASSITSSGRTDVAGEVRTEEGLKAGSVVVGKGSKVTGPIIAATVEVGKDVDLGSPWGLPWWRGSLGRTASVGDIYGKEVKIGANAHAKRIFAESVVIEEGGMADEVTYTKELKLPSSKKYFLAESPVKTETLPPPPR